jgi:hypothetical protein
VFSAVIILNVVSDPYEDQFEKKNKAKKERVAKNELQRLRNIARNMKGKGKRLMSLWNIEI